MKFLSLSFTIALSLLFLFLPNFLSSAQASHSWGNYHWARTINPFTLKLGDNLTTNWDSYVATTSSDWTQSTVLDTTVVPGVTTARRCRPSTGRVEVCNYKYGSNGWLGIAQIWVTGSHITQAATKLNDTYFNTTKYNTPAWKNMVMCQEVGHAFGLDHQDEVFDNVNLDTCMDYTSSPESNQHPNAHDYDQLLSIYSHFDTFSSVQMGTQKLPLGQSISKALQSSDFNSRSEWGREIRNNGYVAVFERDFGNGMRIITRVIFAK